MNTKAITRTGAVTGLLTISLLLFGSTSATASPARTTDPAVTAVTRAANPAQRDSILRLYSAYYLRAPDTAGHSYWAEQYSSGIVPLAAISQFFSQAKEFGDRYGSLSNVQFTELIYTNVLHRIPDHAGEAYWVQRLNLGSSRGSIMIGFSESPEFQRLTGTRPPSPPARWDTQMVALTNAERTTRGLRPVSACHSLVVAAQGHSAWQAQNNVMTHTGVNGSDHGDRMTWAGYTWTWSGENVAMGDAVYTLSDVVQAWMASPSHRANVLNPNFTHLGMGRAVASNGTVHWTQNFGAGDSC